ncbi:MAG TPA: AsmA-like C-terminal region-containing protein [Microvirga sp.]|jgi:AsmA protein|nr:AsmA-like C-terminal region-containing protein [Microvirga sp.]
MRLLTIILAGVTALLVVAGLGLYLGAGPLFTWAAESRLEAETGLDWTVLGTPRLQLSPERMLVVHDIDTRVALPSGASAGLQAKTIKLGGSVTGFFRAFELHRVEAEQPDIHLPTDAWRELRLPKPDWSLLPGSLQVVVRGGTLRQTRGREAGDTLATRINLEASAEPRRSSVALRGSAEVAGEAVRWEVALGPSAGAENALLPVGIFVEARHLPGRALRATAEIAVDGTVLTAAKLSGSLGSSRFSGALLADLAARPFIRVDVGFPTLALTEIQGSRPLGVNTAEAIGPSLSPRSTARLRGFDGRLKLYVGKLEGAAIAASEIAAEAQLRDGNLSVSVNRAELYGGEAQGTLSLLPSGSVPRMTVRGGLTNVQALPLLLNLADIRLLAGVASAQIDVQAAGETSLEWMRTLAGRAELTVTAGRLNTIDLPFVAQLVGSRPDPSGQGGEATIFDRFTTSLTLSEGRATTRDVSLRGPLVEATGSGVIDIPARSLAFRVEPRLVGAGGGPGALVAGLGVLVVVEGPWDAPRVSADLAGLTTPQGAAPVLDALGQMLGGGDKGGLGSLLDQFLSAPSSQPPCPGGCRETEAPRNRRPPR